MDCLDKENAIESAITKNLTGISFVIEKLDPSIEFNVGDTGKVLLNGDCGTFEVADEGVIVTFDESIVAQCGSCIYFEIDEDECKKCDECETELTDLDENTRFAVLDENDCPKLHVTWGKICEFIAEQACIKVCDQLKELVEQSDLTGNTKVVVVTGDGCALLDADKLQCDSEPEPFCCGNDPCEVENEE